MRNKPWKWSTVTFPRAARPMRRSQSRSSPRAVSSFAGISIVTVSLPFRSRGLRQLFHGRVRRVCTWASTCPGPVARRGALRRRLHLERNVVREGAWVYKIYQVYLYEPPRFPSRGYASRQSPGRERDKERERRREGERESYGGFTYLAKPPCDSLRKHELVISPKAKAQVCETHRGVNLFLLNLDFAPGIRPFSASASVVRALSRARASSITRG